MTTLACMLLPLKDITPDPRPQAQQGFLGATVNPSGLCKALLSALAKRYMGAASYSQYVTHLAGKVQGLKPQQDETQRSRTSPFKALNPEAEAPKERPKIARCPRLYTEGPNPYCEPFAVNLDKTHFPTVHLDSPGPAAERAVCTELHLGRRFKGFRLLSFWI